MGHIKLNMRMRNVALSTPSAKELRCPLIHVVVLVLLNYYTLHWTRLNQAAVFPAVGHELLHPSDQTERLPVPSRLELKPFGT